MNLRLHRFLLLLTAAAFGGCSPASGARLAAEMVQPGKSVIWPDGRVIRVERRDGNELAGIRLEQRSKIVQASRGAISIEPDGRSFRVTFFQATVSFDGRRMGTIDEFSVICSK